MHAAVLQLQHTLLFAMYNVVWCIFMMTTAHVLPLAVYSYDISMQTKNTCSDNRVHWPPHAMAYTFGIVPCGGTPHAQVCMLEGQTKVAALAYQGRRTSVPETTMLELRPW